MRRDLAIFLCKNAYSVFHSFSVALFHGNIESFFFLVEIIIKIVTFHWEKALIHHSLASFRVSWSGGGLYHAARLWAGRKSKR